MKCGSEEGQKESQNGLAESGEMKSRFKRRLIEKYQDRLLNLRRISNFQRKRWPDA